ncbi:hypothetical protein MMPV_007470 [Pyropia vietnamensis]
MALFGGSVAPVDEFHNFTSALPGAPLTRWERKAAEAAAAAALTERSSSAANIAPTTPGRSNGRRSRPRTPKSVGKPKTPSAGGDRYIPCRSGMSMDMGRLALNFGGKENGGEPDEGAISTSVAAPGAVPGASTSSTDDGASSSDGDSDRDGCTLSSRNYNLALASSLLESSASNDGVDTDGDEVMTDAVCAGVAPATAASTAVSAGAGADTSSAAASAAAAASKILAFKRKAPAPRDGYVNSTRVLYSAASGPGVSRRKTFRHVPSVPTKVLDAPEMLDDYYLNLLDWNASNILAVALRDTVYLWNAGSGTIQELCRTSTGADDYVTSVSWIAEGNYLAVGTNSAEVQIWDADKLARLRTMRSHAGRVGALAWNGPVLSSGSRDAAIHHHDVRIAAHHTATLAAHTQEVCGLKWSPNGSQLASGGNDNLLCVWDAAVAGGSTTSTATSGTVPTQAPRHVLTAHTAAVKALAWCPWQTNLLATGGGTADRHLRFWNTSSGACVNAVDTRSQVCSIVWNPADKELLTSHGFSQNQLTLWKYPSLTRMAELRGHTSRVLHTALSPDGQTVVSGAADETLRFWNVFAGESGDAPAPTAPGTTAARGVKDGKKALSGSLCIR